MTIRLHDIDTLKAKRQISKSVTANLQNRFKVSVAEVEYLDDKTRLGLGIAAVSSSRRVIDRMFSSVLSYLERDRRLDVESFEQDWL